MLAYFKSEIEFKTIHFPWNYILKIYISSIYNLCVIAARYEYHYIQDRDITKIKK